MNCHQFREYRIEIARDLPLEAGLKTEALAHAEHCSSCRRLLTAERSLHSALASLQRQSAFSADASILESRMLELFRQNKATPPIAVDSPVKVFSSSFWHRQRWLWATAALFILIVFLLGLRVGPYFRHAKIERPISTGKSLALEQASNPSAQLAMPARSSIVSKRVRPILRSSEKTKIPTPLRREIGNTSRVLARKSTDEPNPEHTTGPLTDFIEVSPPDDIYPREFQQVVRVRLPRASLTRFGFPVNVERINEPVQADLLLSQEGWIKAVRLVK